ncbi:class I SAM-dependent methyltransferase [Lysobacter olei]
MGTSGFKDHFSGIADAYAAARPEYPDALFDAIAAHVPAGARVWEPGCGSGQATRGLAARFAHVHATDPSAQQLAQHWAHAGAASLGDSSPTVAPARIGPADESGTTLPSAAPRVSLAVEPGERTALPGGSVQLIAVAQALHWFDRPKFFAECQRVLAPGGVLAAWGYPDFLAPEGMVEAVEAFRARIEPYWPPERAQIDARYAGYDWPFPALPTPTLWLEAEWPLGHFLRYLGSMSASARCQAATGIDPVAHHGPALAAAWGDAADLRTITWPLFLHLRRKP